MASIIPFIDQYHIHKNFECNKPQKPLKNSIIDIIYNHKDLTIFASIMKKYENIHNLIDDYNEYTLFVPSDSEMYKKYTEDEIKYIKESLETDTCINIIKFSLLKRRLSNIDFTSNTSFTVPTFNRQTALLVENTSGITVLNNTSKVIHWNQNATNGIIHITDNIIMPYN